MRYQTTGTRAMPCRAASGDAAIRRIAGICAEGLRYAAYAAFFYLFIFLGCL